MPFITSTFLVRKGFSGMAIWPFIIARNKEKKLDKTFLNHERIHLRQQIELLIIPFFIWYGIEYLIRLVQYGNGREAYLNISFEREAYAKQNDFYYLKKRMFWEFLKYCKNSKV